MLRRSLLAAPALLALPAVAQDKLRMTIATGVDPAFSHFYVAKEGGFFDRNGLEVTVNTGPSGSAMVAFLVGNQVNAAFGAEQAGVSAHIVDANVVVVAEGTALLRWMGILARNIADMDGLKGKRIGIARGTASETLWLSIIAKYGLNAADYTIVNVEAPEMVAAIERGNIDAFVVWGPWLTWATRAVSGTKVLVTNENIQIIRNLVYMNKGWVEQNQRHRSASAGADPGPIRVHRKDPRTGGAAGGALPAAGPRVSCRVDDQGGFPPEPFRRYRGQCAGR